MQNLMGKASKGYKEALLELFRMYSGEVKALCSGCLNGKESADEIVVQAFGNTWGNVLNKTIQTEEEFRTSVLKNAALLCRKKIMKKGMKSFPLPKDKNFHLIVGNINDYTYDTPAMEILLNTLPVIQRFIFSMHYIAGFDENMIAVITGYKEHVVENALEAEQVNNVKIFEKIENKSGLKVNLESELLRYKETMELEKNSFEQAKTRIEMLTKPYEKKRKLKWAGCTVLGIAIIAGIAAGSFFTKTEVEEAVETEKETEDDQAVETEEQTGEADAGYEDETSEAGEISDEGVYYCADIDVEGYGTITVELDYETAPVTVENFVELAESGFYDGLTFHRIMDGFMIQGGDPNGDGTGGSEETIIGEFSDNGYENDISHTRGVISMARSSEYDSASSQFFIVQEDSTFLDGQYAAFGYVTEGMEIVDAICADAEPTDDNGTIETDQQPVINSIIIREME